MSTAINISANMSLPIPIPGQEPGPQWATDIVNCLTIIDQHMHAPNYGVVINPAGININSDLPFNNFNALSLRSSRYQAQSAPLSLPTDIGCTYVSGVDLYYNDINGNQVRITQSGGVAGSPGSISNLTSPASASYVSGSSTFVWQSAANTSAIMDFSSAILRNLTANSFGLSLVPPSAMGANFTLTLPTVPAAQGFMTLDTSGNLSASAIPIANGITGSMMANATVTNTQLAAVNYQISASSAAYTSTTTGNITNLSVTITTLGKPVFVGLIGPNVPGAHSSYIGVSSTSTTAGAFAQLEITRNAVACAQYSIGQASGQTSSNGTSIFVPPSSLSTIDLVVIGTPGTYTYLVTITGLSVSSTLTANYCSLIAYEL